MMKQMTQNCDNTPFVDSSAVFNDLAARALQSCKRLLFIADPLQDVSHPLLQLRDPKAGAV